MSKNKLPNNWQIKKLNDVSRKLSLNKLKIKQKEYLPSGLFPVIDQGHDLIGGYYNDESLLVSDEPPYIIFGDHTKIKKYIPFKFIPGADGVKVLKAKENILPKFLFYLLFTIKIEDKGYARHFQLLEKESFLIPDDLETQQAIVSKIEELFSELDKGIEDLKTAQQQLKTYRQSVLKWAFEGKLTNENVKEGELMKGWEWTTIGEVSHNVEYGSSSKSKKEGKIPVLRMGNIQNGIFDWNDLVFSDDDNEIKKYLLKKNDVLFNRTNSAELVGKTAIYKGERPAIFAGYLIRINRIEELIDAAYLTYYLNTKEAKKYGNSVRSFGVNQSNINGTKLKTYPIPLATLKEQLQIVQEIESRLSVADKMEESIAQSLQQAEALRQSILKKAFSGELV
jgi:type I restriction enzyme S subunit